MLAGLAFVVNRMTAIPARPLALARRIAAFLFINPEEDRASQPSNPIAVNASAAISAVFVWIRSFVSAGIAGFALSPKAKNPRAAANRLLYALWNRHLTKDCLLSSASN